MKKLILIGFLLVGNFTFVNANELLSTSPLEVSEGTSDIVLPTEVYESFVSEFTSVYPDIEPPTYEVCEMRLNKEPMSTNVIDIRADYLLRVLMHIFLGTPMPK